MPSNTGNKLRFRRLRENEIDPCPICPRQDRDWIETLMASDMPYDYISREFGIPVRELRRHEAMHSTKQPTIDGLSILRQMRWLNEEILTLTRREINMTNGKTRTDLETFNRRIHAIKTCLDVVKEHAKLINAREKIDPRVVLPRWHLTIAKLAERLKDIPGANEALAQWAKEESPENAGIYIKPKLLGQQEEENGKAEPPFFEQLDKIDEVLKDANGEDKPKESVEEVEEVTNENN